VRTVVAAIVASLLGAPLAAQDDLPQAQRGLRADAWQIGPVIGSRNYSVGMPLSPIQGPQGWHFDFPYAVVEAGHVHYLTFNHGPLTGKRKIVLRYRIDARPGVRFVSQEHPHLPATLSLYFQRRGDNWKAKGRFEAYRWYSPNENLVSLAPGEHKLELDLDDRWISVWGHTAATNPAGFKGAIDEADRVGFVFGSREGRGHGVYATGPARFTVLSFETL